MHVLKPLTLIVLAILMSSTAQAIASLDYGSHEISVTLESGQDAAYLIPMESGDRLIVRLVVSQGGPVDFYLTNVTAYNVYRAGVSGSSRIRSLYYLGGQSSEDCFAIRYSYDSYVGNQYVLLIDNTANTETGAVPVGQVTVEGSITLERNIWTPANVAITLAVVVGAVLFMAYLRWPGKRR